MDAKKIAEEAGLDLNTQLESYTVYYPLRGIIPDVKDYTNVYNMCEQIEELWMNGGLNVEVYDFINLCNKLKKIGSYSIKIKNSHPQPGEGYKYFVMYFKTIE